MGKSEADAAMGLLVTLRRPVVWLSIAIFFVYTGLEMVAGQWGFSLFTEARGAALGVAGFWMSLYWGGITLGRVALGAVAERVGVERLLRASLLLALVGALFVWLRAPALNGLAMPLLGLGLAPIFPSLTSRTAERVGPAHAHNSIGLQTG
ncbi:MFS transporter, partial [Arthrospira platensis SPKY1]|nr:MFS transporter [Arthrospira platensis SPKY1]